MSSDDAASWQGNPPLDDAPEQPTEPSADPGEAFATDPWGVEFADALSDPTATNLFSAEIENVNATDWDDADSIWGDEAGNAVIDDGGDIGFDFPI